MQAISLHIQSVRAEASAPAAERAKNPPPAGAASGCNLAVSALRRNDDILWARSDSPFLRGVGARLRYVFNFIY